MRRYAAAILLVVATVLAVDILTLWKPIAAQSSGSFSPSDGTAQPASSESSVTQKLAGLEQPVTVIRDTWGVPHIYAQNQHDMFFAQGYATAQDRLFQMELWKRTGQGTLAEILGGLSCSGTSAPDSCATAEIWLRNMPATLRTGSKFWKLSPTV